MRRPDKSQLASKIPSSIRTLIDVKRKNFFDKINSIIPESHNIEFMVDVFNDTSAFREPDTLGISMFYPGIRKCSHSLTEFFPIEITTKDLTVEINRMVKTLIGKIPESSKTDKVKELKWES